MGPLSNYIFEQNNKKLFSKALELCSWIREKGGFPLFVGGCVRDALLKEPIEDIDIEVFGMTAQELEKCLQKFSVNCVGKKFGVFKLPFDPIDIALPRQEICMGKKHKDFKVKHLPALSFAEAAARRDFTINAMGWDPFDDKLWDAFHGLEDLSCRVLRHTSEQFGEDALRVLRGMHFVARFELSVVPETLAICRTMTMVELPKERLFEEWKKMLLKGKKISLGLEFLRQSYWVKNFPELDALINCEQDAAWHPEGDVWNHILICMDAFAQKRVGDYEEDLILGFATLCHDFGKPLTTKAYEGGRLRSLGHDVRGEQPTRQFLSRLSSSEKWIKSIVVLVTNHMFPYALIKGGASDSALRRLAARVGRLDRLLRLVEFDRSGRPQSAEEKQILKWFKERVEILALQDARPKPILLGRHLIQLGYKSAPWFKKVLDQAYEAQLDGVFSSEAEAQDWLKQKTRDIVP